MTSRLSLLILVAVAAELHPQTRPASSGTIAGIVADTARAPIEAVEVVGGIVGRSITDSLGRFRLESVPKGRHLLVARRIGFSPESASVAVTDGQTTEVRFTLRAAAAELGSVSIVDEHVVPPRLVGFEERRAKNRSGGQFMVRAEIDRIMPGATSDIVRRLRGVRLQDSMGVTLAISTRGPKLSNLRAVQCVVRIGVDGQIKEPYFPMNTIVQSDIYGIEVYQGAASLPPEFGGARRDAACGLIMIWTRSR